MEKHRYSVGQVVDYRPGAFEKAAAGGSYEVMRQLPAEYNSNQYRIKSMRDGHERVVKESQLGESSQHHALGVLAKR